MIKRMTTKSTALMMAMSIILSACAAPPQQQQSSSSQDDAQRTRTEGTFFGALIGGLLGAAINKNDRGKGAAIGAAIGAGAGYVVGNEIAKRKKQYASEEDFLDAEIQTAREFNRTASEYNNHLREEIAYLDNHSQQLKFRYDQGNASYQELNNEKRQVQERLAEIKASHKDLEAEYNIKVAVYEEQAQKRHRNDKYLVQLQREIVNLKANLDGLQKHSVQLARIDERLVR